MNTVTVSLVSHTNVGKTTLARTLLRRDVGAVLDQAHVTDISEAHELIRSDGDVLRLWDTPGFGDTARLIKRLRQEGSPVGWLMHQVWDRFSNRALFCSQEAVRNVRDEADAVLYLVNAAEDPHDAGYVAPELEVLGWIGRPVVLVLNQTAGADETGHLARWQQLVGEHEVVRDVLPLDAFARCWVQEERLFERVAQVLPEAGEKAAAMNGLVAAWRARNLTVFEACVAHLAEYVAAGARTTEPLPDGGNARKAASAALDRLSTSLEAETSALMERLVAAHGLSGRSVEALQASLDDVVGPPKHDQPKTGVWAVVGAAASGALGGLAADVMAGGMTLGGGALLGAILGALGGAGAAKGVELVRDKGDKTVRWSPEFLTGLLQQALLRYLAVAHFGRGRGDFRRVEEPAWWRAEIERASAPRAARMESALRKVASGGGSEPIRGVLREVLVDVLTARYPGGALTA